MNEDARGGESASSNSLPQHRSAASAAGTSVAASEFVPAAVAAAKISQLSVNAAPFQHRQNDASASRVVPASAHQAAGAAPEARQHTGRDTSASRGSARSSVPRGRGRDGSFPGARPGSSSHSTHGQQNAPQQSRHHELHYQHKRQQDFYHNLGLRKDARKRAQLKSELPGGVSASHTTGPSSGVGPMATEFVNQYYAITALESKTLTVPSLVGSRTCVNYRALSATDGELYLLRRVVGPISTRSDCIIRAAEAWRSLQHPGLCRLAEVFTTRRFSHEGTVNEVVFVYEFYVRAASIKSVYLDEQTTHRATSSGYAVPENAIWSLATQLVCAMHTVHRRLLHCGDAINPSAVIMHDRNRVRIGQIGIQDAMDTDMPSSSSPEHAQWLRVRQHEDILKLGLLIVTMCARTQPGLVRGGVLMASVEHVFDFVKKSGVYSGELLGFTRSLIEPLLIAQADVRLLSIEVDVLPLLAYRFSFEFANVWNHVDHLEKGLMEEADTSRYLRLQTMLNFCIDRCDQALDPLWSETGRPHILKLFRDYAFHTSDVDGRPLLDYAHVLECLDRLDASSHEQIVLTSHDGATLILVTFAEISQCLAGVIRELSDHV
ncbi:PAB-dependent poly(A)-specific ribonuclease subunit PAN3 [Porphyridium purpureum]|uniref:PAB-dependent poly(A)-specific ribonuclease subunit PAN3 n=1 Tax=Porphyridium purpureum TaxID=35688 RepID=A0A5J4YSG9_PORPP|nr:PAB-dependent poly(A)-specific ribonuclease subunit PAN3 [Porphyridium purpureum]|eukprot:POR1063..scf229_5